MKVARFAIFLTGILSLALAGMMSISTLQSQQEEVVLRTNDALKIEAQAYVDHWFSVIDAAKTGTPLPYVIGHALVKLNQGIPTEIESISNTSDRANEAPDLLLEERLLKGLKDQVTLNDLRISKISIGTYELSELGTKQGIYIATTDDAKTEGDAINKIKVTLLNPTQAFAGFTKVSNSNQNVYLFDKNGRVMMHSTPAYIGTDLKKIEDLKPTLENLFLGAQTGSVSRYVAIDGTREQAAFIRTGIFPFAIGVEQKVAPAVFTMDWISNEVHSGAARKNLGMISLFVGIALALFSGISFWLSHELKKQISLNANAREQNQENPIETLSLQELNIKPPIPNRAAPPPKGVATQLPTAGSLPPSIERATEIFNESRNRIQQEKTDSNGSLGQIIVDRDYVTEFANKIRGSFAIESTEKELVQIASELTESPVLYFRYHRKNQTITLASTAGKVKVPNYSLMQAYVRKDIEQQVEKLANEGKVASVSNYAPISKLMMTSLNVGHFEAWVVTTDTEISGQSSRMVGVLIVLQAGFRSAESRPILARILREAGNTLFAQGNRIRPKSMPMGMAPGTVQA